MKCKTALQETSDGKGADTFIVGLIEDSKQQLQQNVQGTTKGKGANI